VHICLPCLRLFRSKETYIRHTHESVLHIKTSYELQQKKAREENEARIIAAEEEKSMLTKRKHSEAAIVIAETESNKRQKNE